MLARRWSQPPSQSQRRARSQQATLPAKYVTKRTLPGRPIGHKLPMEPPGRHYLCAGCRTAVVICSHCDRGNRYCNRACSQAARKRNMRQAGKRYQSSLPGRHRHAARQRRYRARMQKVTHQGSPPAGVADLLAAEPTVPETPSFLHCCRCHRALPAWVRQDFLRCRIRHSRQNRSPHAHPSRN